MRRIFSALFLVVGIVLLASAFLAAPAAHTATSERILRLNVNSTDIHYLDPALNYDFYGWRLEAATCAMLLGYPDKAGPASARLDPEVATGFPKVSGNGRTYTYTLRSGFRFSDGTPVTAGELRARNRAGARAEDAVARRDLLQRHRGGRQGPGGQGNSAGRRRRRGNTLTITLTKAAAGLHIPDGHELHVRHPAEPADRSAGRQHASGAGPYYVSSKETGSQIVLRKNPYYGGTRRQNWDVIRVIVEMGEQASYLQVRKGEADLDLYSLPVAAHTELTKEFGINKGRYFVHPSNSISYFALNTSRGLFKDPKVRRAVAYAINRPALTRLGGLNAGTPNEQILPPGIPGYRNADIYPLGAPDIAKAKALLGGTTGRS